MQVKRRANWSICVRRGVAITSTDWISVLIRTICVCTPVATTMPFACPAATRVPENAIFRSEEQTSELQSLMRSSNAAVCLKKNRPLQHTHKYLKQLSAEPAHTFTISLMDNAT